MPNLVLIAGPHGAGKTSIMSRATGHSMKVGRFVDPQDIFERLKDHYAKAEFENIPVRDYAARAFDRAFTVRFNHIKKKHDVTVLCSLGAIADLDLMDAARKNGYHISLYFFGVENWKICRDYIRQSKKHWLSEMPDEHIYGDYHRAMAMLPGAILQADTGRIYDHSSLKRPKPLLEIDNGRIQVIEKTLPNWILEPLSRCL